MRTCFRNKKQRPPLPREGGLFYRCVRRLFRFEFFGTGDLAAPVLAQDGQGFFLGQDTAAAFGVLQAILLCPSRCCVLLLMVVCLLPVVRLLVHLSLVCPQPVLVLVLRLVLMLR